MDCNHFLGLHCIPYESDEYIYKNNLEEILQQFREYNDDKDDYYMFEYCPDCGKSLDIPDILKQT